MAKLEKLSNTKWRQPFCDRKNEFRSWNSQPDIAKYCQFRDGTKRLLRIEFEKKFNLVIEDRFQITSGLEISFKKEFQDIIRPIILENPDSYFIVHVLDVPDSSSEISDESVTTNSIVEVITRVGQERFRKDLIEYWQGCSLTGCDLVSILRASHIKPWKDSNNVERLDVYNGLLLLPTLDVLFDKGFISFSDTGTILISSEIENRLNEFGLDKDNKLMQFEKKHETYLKHHRESIFKH
jgi:putative restriction endonuclease